MKACLEAAGSDLDHVLECNVLFQAFNAIYAGYLPVDPAADSTLAVALVSEV